MLSCSITIRCILTNLSLEVQKYLPQLRFLHSEVTPATFTVFCMFTRFQFLQEISSEMWTSKSYFVSCFIHYFIYIHECTHICTFDERRNNLFFSFFCQGLPPGYSIQFHQKTLITCFLKFYSASHHISSTTFRIYSVTTRIYSQPSWPPVNQ